MAFKSLYAGQLFTEENMFPREISRENKPVRIRDVAQWMKAQAV